MPLPCRGLDRKTTFTPEKVCSAPALWLIVGIAGVLMASRAAYSQEPKPRLDDAQQASVAGIKPAPLKEDRTTVNLPSPVQQVCVGGGGRFLILHLPGQRKLAVFDCNEARIVKYLPVAEDTIHFAAGLEKLFVASPDHNVLQRWDLKTFERDVTVSAPVPITGLAMGSATKEPLIVQSDREGLVFLDPRTFRRSDYRIGQGGGNWMGGGGGSQLRVSANGQVITGSGVLVRVGRTYRAVGAPGDTLPTPDGRVLYGRQQLYTAEGKPEGKPLGKAFSGHGQRFWFIPAVQGPYAVFYNQVSGSGATAKVQLGVYLAGETRQLVTLPEVEGILGLVDWQSGVSQPIEQHLFLIPDAKLLVFIPASKEKLVLYRADIEQLLDKADIDYLYVKSLPPANFKPGSDFTYQIATRSRKGGVKYKLESGPGRMSLSPEGLLTWKVPADFTDKEINVIITVSDRTGQEIFHTFSATSPDGAGAKEPDRPREK
jgi:hypothetical protein